MSLKKNIVNVFFVNFLSLISGIIIAFVVPAILSVESYSNVKTYTFYLSYLGILHFGFVDGMYIKYGGKELNHIDKSEFKYEHRIFTIIQLLVTAIVLTVAFISKDIIIFLLAVSIIPVNTLQFHQLFYQAIGEFKAYSKSLYIFTFANLIFNILLAIIMKNQSYVLYCLATLLANVIAYASLEIKFYYATRKVKAKKTEDVWKNIKVGFFILIGNLSVIIFLGIDRWFVKLFFDVYQFGYYSFAVSMLGIMNILVNAISITFYNYLSKEENMDKLKELKAYLLILGGFASLGYFALAAIVNIFLKKYIPSLSIIAISFAAYPYMIIINALYVNLYKARKDERAYVIKVFKMVGISIIYNLIALCIFKNSIAIAAATTIAFITWYIYSMKDFKYLKATVKEIIYLGILLTSFLILSHKLNWFYGGIGYLLVLAIVNFVSFKKEIFEMIRIVIKK